MSLSQEVSETDAHEVIEALDDRPRVYQAGPIRNVPITVAHDVRDELAVGYEQFEWLNPLDEHDLSSDGVTVVCEHSGRTADDVDGPTVTAHEIVEDDKDLLESSDALFAWFPAEVVSVGTTMEVKHAYERDIPVVVWYDVDYADSNQTPPIWLDDHVDAISSHRETAVDRLATLVDDRRD